MEHPGEQALDPTPLDAEVLTIGDELNRGEIVDTNSSWLAERLTSIGLHVRWRSSVTDDPADLGRAIVLAAGRARWVVASGGLGPTEDDRTVDQVCALLGCAPQVDPGHAARMRERLAERGFRITPNNERQVRVPAGAKVLANPVGMAPGFQVRLGGAELAFLPGVPREMKAIFEESLAPALAPSGAGRAGLARRTWRLAGIGESHVDHALLGLLAGIPGATLHFRIAFPEILVTAVIRRPSQAEAEAALLPLDAEVRARLGEHLYGIDGESLAAALGRELLGRGATLALAESCTGGLVGELVTAVPGASAWFLGGVVAYANEAKTRLLGVPAELLAAQGAVSEETALAMADGARAALGSSHAIAVTGIAGPGGGSADKPVGTVYLAVTAEGVRQARRVYWPAAREQVRQLAASAALHLLYKTLRRQPGPQMS